MTLEEFTIAVKHELQKTDYDSMIELIRIERGGESLSGYDAIRDELIKAAYAADLLDALRVAYYITKGLKAAYEDYSKIIGLDLGGVKH